MTRFPFFHALSCSLLALASQALGWQPSGESVPAAPQEFRAAWISTVHNIDWPSRTGLSGAAQRAELLTILKTMVREKNLAVRMSLHELDLADRVSDTVVCVSGDRIDSIGTPKEIFTSDYIARLYHMEPGRYDPCFDTLDYVPKA